MIVNYIKGSSCLPFYLFACCLSSSLYFFWAFSGWGLYSFMKVQIDQNFYKIIITTVMLGYFIGYIYKYRLSVCVQNLARAFPHLSYRDINGHRRSFYSNIGRILWEMFLFGRGKLKLSDTAFDTIKRLAEEQRQAVFLAGHYGNWEVLNQLPKFTNSPVHALYKPLKNRAFDVFVYKRRTRYGMRLLPAKRALRILLRKK